MIRIISMTTLFLVVSTITYAEVDSEKTGKICNLVKAGETKAATLAGLGAGAIAGTKLATTAVGVNVVTHSSGALILSGSSGYIAGTLGTIAATTVGVLSSPVTITVAAVTTAAISSAVYFCSD